MSKIDIISGFLGAGKTTLIKKLIAEAYQNEKIVLIENEFGEIGIDGTFLKDSGVTINEMNSGCICCSLVGDFETSLKEVLDTYHPDRVIIEPSGVGKLSDVIKAVSTINSDEMELDNFITVVDAKKCRMYTKNFGEFYNNQVEHASLIVLSRSQDLTEFQLKECLDILKGLNDHSPIITTAWDKLNGLDIINACEVNIQEELLHEHDHECCGHDHHEHDHDHDHHHHHEHRNLYDVNTIIDNSSLDENTKALAKRIFLRVAKAESKVHNKPLDEVHFHEVGAIDSIVDIVGTAILINKINPEKIIASVVNDGYGFIECAHGTMAVPVPATSEIFAASNVKFKQIDIDTELDFKIAETIINQ